MRSFSTLWEMFKTRLSVFKKAAPIRSSADFGEFLAGRAAFICQKTLYGYVKTRMGMQYPLMFDDQTFIDSLNIAKWNLYAACLSDLAIFMAAEVCRRDGGTGEAAKIARYWYAAIVRDRFAGGDFTGDKDALIAAFDRRLALTDWNTAAEREGAFTESPPALIRWAPIEDKLKKLDEPLVINSIRFQWQRVRREFRDLFDREAFLADWRGGASVAPVKTSTV